MIEKTTRLPNVATSAYLVLTLALVISMFALDGFYSMPVFQQMANSALFGALMWITFSILLVLCMHSTNNKSLRWSARIAAAISVCILLTFNIVSTFGGVIRQAERYKEELTVGNPSFEEHLLKLKTQERLNETVLLEKQAEAYQEGKKRIMDVTVERIELVESDFEKQIENAESRLIFQSRNGKKVVGDRYNEAKTLLEGLRTQKSALRAQIVQDETTALANLNSENLKAIAVIKENSAQKQATIEAEFKQRLASNTGSVVDLISNVVNSTLKAFGSKRSITIEQATVFLALFLAILLLFAVYVASSAFLSLAAPYVKSELALSQAQREINLAIKRAQAEAIHAAVKQ